MKTVRRTLAFIALFPMLLIGIATTLVMLYSNIDLSSPSTCETKTCTLKLNTLQ
jgi:ribose/xylose/arabinose/galactoside ABC-type transport system permease subunit